MSDRRFRVALIVLSALSVLLWACTGPPSSTPDQAMAALGQPSQTPGSVEISPLTSVTSAPSGIDQQKAETAIGAFVGRPNIVLTFVEVTIMINSPDADVQVAVYTDDQGARYSLDSSYRVVEFQASPIRGRPGEPLGLDRIRQIAEDLASAAIPGFDQLNSSLSYEEGNKDGVFFFRWQDNSQSWKYNPPIFQVGIQSDGELLSYINALALP